MAVSQLARRSPHWETPEKIGGFMMGLWAWKKHGQRILRFIKALKKTMANLLWPILSVGNTIVCFVRSIFFS
jgi:hypothetical protein